MKLPNITAELRIALEPNLRFTPSGKAVWSARCVTNPRRKNAAGDWEDGDPTWVDVVAWDRLATNAAESLQPKDMIIVYGRLSVEEWESGDKKGTSTKITAEWIGPSLTYDQAKVIKVERTDGQQQAFRTVPTRPEQDPWAEPAGGQTDEPPF